MKLYKPVLIESAEQAEALPIGTIAIVGEPPIESSVKWDDRLWYGGRDFEDGEPSRRMVGALALVPIEAEEEFTTALAQERWGSDADYDSRENVRRDGWSDPIMVRLVARYTLADNQ